MEKAFEPYVDGSTNTVIKVVGVGGAGGNGNDSGLWTANQHNGAPEAKGQGAAEAKAEDEKPRFEYGIPAFLRKKN